MAEWFKAVDCKSIGKPSLVRIQPHPKFNFKGEFGLVGRASDCGPGDHGFETHSSPLKLKIRYLCNEGFQKRFFSIYC